MDPRVATVVLVPLLGVAAALLTTAVGRFVKIPLVVFEIVLGLVIGPSVLGWVPETDSLSALANFGLAFLFFMAGNEIDFRSIAGRPLRTASLGWLASPSPSPAGPRRSSHAPPRRGRRRPPHPLR